MEDQKIFLSIQEDLRIQKNLEFINLKEDQFDLGNIFHVQDKNNDEFSLKIIPLTSDGSNLIDEIKLKEAQNYSISLKKCNHPHVIKFHDKFQIGNNYFILMERSSISLQNYIQSLNNQVKNSKDFINKAIQILEATYYLHTNDLVLSDISINNIMIDDQGFVKITSIGRYCEIDYQFTVKSLETSLQKNKLFYYPPEHLDIKNFDQKKVMLSYDDDTWQIGICLYFMAGSSFQHILNYIQYKEPYLISKRLGVDINMILIYILQRNPNKTRPSIPYLIQSFKNLKKNDETNSKQMQIQQTNESQTNDEILEFTSENQQFIEDLINGIDFFNSDQYEKSLSLLDKCLYMKNMNDIPLYFKAKAYDNQGSLKEAIVFYNKSIQINSSNDSAYNNLGLIYSQQSDFEQAIICFNKCFEINKKNDFAIYNLGKMYRLDYKKHDQSINCFKQVIEINPLDYEAYICLGLIYYDKNQYGTAISSFKQAIEINSKQPNSYINLASVYYEKYMFDEAIFYYNKAKEYEHSNEIFYNLGLTYYKKGQLIKSILYFQKSIALSPKDGSAYLNLALNFQDKSKYEKAFKYIQIANKYYEELNNNDSNMNEIKSQI